MMLGMGRCCGFWGWLGGEESDDPTAKEPLGSGSFVGGVDA